MKIVIDGRMLYWTGVGRYIKEILDNLQELDRENEYVVLVRRADWDKWEPAADNFRKVECNVNPYTFGEQLRLPLVLLALRPDLVHFTAPNTPLLWRGRRVVTVHDLTLLDYDTSRGTGFMRWVRACKRLPFRWVVKNDARFATIVLSLTEYGKRRLVRRFKSAESRVVVTPEAGVPLEAKPEPIKKWSLGDEYLLYVGNFYPYKNVGLAVEAMKRLAPQHPELKLAVAGSPDWFRDQLEKKAWDLGVANRVVWLGRVTDGELVSLYRGARAYVYPSYSEGFGLQGLEAMSQDLPVVAAKASCLPEVYGEAAEYFDPHKAADMAKAVERVLDDPKRRKELVAAGREHEKKFSWRKAAELTLEAYKRALEG